MSKKMTALPAGAPGQVVSTAESGNAQARTGGGFYSIGDLAREYDVTLRTLRFYEDKGLLNPIRDGMTRLYSDQDREHLKLILKGKRLGFTLVEIGEMIGNGGEDASGGLALSADTVMEQIAHLERQRQEIDEALTELRRSYEGLSRNLTDTLHTRG